MSTETTTADFQCDQCEKSFKTQAGLSIHKLRTHEGRHWSRNSSKPAVKPKRVRSETPATAHAEPAPPSAPPANVVEFCPRCGCHIGEVERTLRAVAEIDRDNPQVYRVDLVS